MHRTLTTFSAVAFMVANIAHGDELTIGAWDIQDLHQECPISLRLTFD